jgi:hypothetical protein
MHTVLRNRLAKIEPALAVWLVLFCGSAVLAQGASAEKTDPYPSATPQAVVDVSNRIFPAVVRLDVAQEVYAEGKRTVVRGIG